MFANVSSWFQFHFQNQQKTNSMVWFFMLVPTRRCQLGSISQEPRCEPLVLTLQIKYPHNTKITNIGWLLKIWIEPKRLSRWFFKKMNYDFQKNQRLDSNIYQGFQKNWEKSNNWSKHCWFFHENCRTFIEVFLNNQD